MIKFKKSISQQHFDVKFRKVVAGAASMLTQNWSHIVFSRGGSFFMFKFLFFFLKSSNVAHGSAPNSETQRGKAPAPPKLGGFDSVLGDSG
jgi:hypothetical protein